MNLVLIIFQLFYLTAYTSNSQPKLQNTILQNLNDSSTIFTWSTECNSGQCVFDSRKYTKQQLEGTSELIYINPFNKPFETQTAAFKPEDIVNLNLNELNNEFIEKLDHLKSLQTVNDSYWIKLKAKSIKNLEDWYLYSKILIQAYSDPGILLNNKYSWFCPEYATALNTSDTTILFNCWKKLVNSQSKNNGDPKKFMEIFYDQYNSDKNTQFAKVALIIFGWGNCVHKHIFATNNYNEEKNINLFKKLFISVKYEFNCD